MWQFMENLKVANEASIRKPKVSTDVLLMLS